MLRALVFVAALILFRSTIVPPRNSARLSPYRTGLDGHLTAQQLSALVEEIELMNHKPPIQAKGFGR
jgi:hypothetical protein